MFRSIFTSHYRRSVYNYIKQTQNYNIVDTFRYQVRLSENLNQIHYRRSFTTHVSLFSQEFQNISSQNKKIRTQLKLKRNPNTITRKEKPNKT